jgi:hypothetical protein
MDEMEATTEETIYVADPAAFKRDTTMSVN